MRCKDLKGRNQAVILAGNKSVYYPRLSNRIYRLSLQELCTNFYIYDTFGIIKSAGRMQKPGRLIKSVKAEEALGDISFISLNSVMVPMYIYPSTNVPNNFPGTSPLYHSPQISPPKIPINIRNIGVILLSPLSFQSFIQTLWQTTWKASMNKKKPLPSQGSQSSGTVSNINKAMRW